MMHKYAVVLTGGGARAAYQVGVLKAISDVLPDNRNPFQIICGTSAGAINAVAMAGSGDHFAEAVGKTEELWGRLKVTDVYRADLWGVMRCLLHWAKALLRGGRGEEQPVSILDNSPLRDFLAREIDFNRIQRAIDQRMIEAISITACGYSSGESVTFFQGVSTLLGWRRFKRIGVACQLDLRHVLASSAIPTIFSPVKINREYFGDGAIRQLAPMSPALHLGASHILVVGVSANTTTKPERKSADGPPSIAQIVGHLFNSIFLDTLEADIEHLQRVNGLLEMASHCEETKHIPLKPIETLIISPSRPIDLIAARHISELPRNIRRMFRSVGANGFEGGASMASYLLFEGKFCRDLIDLGYRDGLRKRSEIQEFFREHRES